MQENQKNSHLRPHGNQTPFGLISSNDPLNQNTAPWLCRKQPRGYQALAQKRVLSPSHTLATPQGFHIVYPANKQ